MSTITAFDITVRNWCKCLKSLSWWPWTQAPTWTLDNPDNFVVHACGAFMLELSFVAINNLPQLNSFKSYLICSFLKQCLFISRMPIFLLHYLLAITDRISSWCWNIVYSCLLKWKQSASRLSHLCCFQLGSWQEWLAQLDCVPSLRHGQQCYVFLRHTTLSKMVALSMAAMELMV